MINWEATKQQFGYDHIDNIRNRPQVITICDNCNRQGSVKIRTMKELVNGQRKWECRKCRNTRTGGTTKMSIASQTPEANAKRKATLQSPESRKRRSDAWHASMPEIMNSESYKAKKKADAAILWESPDYRNKIVASSKSIWENEELSAQMLKSRQTPEYRENQRLKAIERWKDPIYKAKQEITKATRSAEHLAEIRRNQPKVTKIQNILYSILDDLNVKYYRERNDGVDDQECTIGPYSFDCVVPRTNKPTLLIECQGDYWHGLRGKAINDKAKLSYINNNFEGQYEVKYIWEHEFLNKDRVIDSIRYWLNISKVDIVNYEFAQVEIKDSPSEDYRGLLAKYHYLTTAGRGGISYGAYLDGKLIAVCIFSPLPRQNINIIGYTQTQVRELSRLCIHPNYRKTNFGSWFISRCLGRLPNKYKAVIAYSDTTFNHVGGIYQASNFKFDKEVEPDYWYVSTGGWVMHKKTLYNHAIKMHTTESEFASQNGYHKVYGNKKLRFIYER